MKILHISKYYFPFIGGVEQVARDCVNSLKDCANQKVICFNHEKGNKSDLVDEVEVKRVGCFAKVASQSLSFSYGKELKKIMKEFQPDIVIFQYPNPFVAHYLCKTFKKKNFKLILWWQLDITKQKMIGKFFDHQNKKMVTYTDKIVATSPNYIEGSKYLKAVKEKCVVIPCCVDEGRLKANTCDYENAKKIRENDKGKTICFAFGRHVEYKGLTYLIESCSNLDDRFSIYIGGKGPLTEELMEQAKDNPRIHFLGRITNDELKAYLIACDIFCFPSITKNEAFGIGLVEAMYYSKPVITFTIPGSGVNYVNQNGITGLEVKNRNVLLYKEAIEQLANDEELRNRLGENGHKWMEENFTQERFILNVKTLMEDLNK